MWPEAIDCSIKVSIRELDNVRDHHEGLEWEENCGD